MNSLLSGMRPRYDGSSGSGGSFQGTWYDTVTADGYEKVTTKVGTFDAFVVTKKKKLSPMASAK